MKLKERMYYVKAMLKTFHLNGHTTGFQLQTIRRLNETLQYFIIYFARGLRVNQRNFKLKTRPEARLV